MKKQHILLLLLLITVHGFSQESQKAKTLLDQVSAKMGAYKNMHIGFNSSFSNEEAGILEGDEAPIKGTIILQGELYNLDYIGNTFIFDGHKIYVINHEEKEINITEEDDIEEDDGFIYPSKLLTFYKEGYTFSMGKATNKKGRKIQFVNLTPIDSNSDIVKVQLAIDSKTKHIYKLIQTGSNGAKTTFTISQFKSNQTLSKDLFTVDKASYLKQNYTID